MAAQPNVETQAASNQHAEKGSRRLLVPTLTVVFLYLAAGIYYGISQDWPDRFVDWIWFISTGLGLAATAALSALFYLASNRLPQRISSDLTDLVDRLQSPVTGYETVTKRIIEVCSSARHYYHAATRMPLIGAIGPDRNYCREYTEALTTNVLAGRRVQLLCLDDASLAEFVLTGEMAEDPEARMRLLGEFLEHQVPYFQKNPDTNFQIARAKRMPFQMAVADGERAIFYFSPRTGLTHESDIRGIYTEDRDIISVLVSGFRYLMSEAQDSDNVTLAGQAQGTGPGGDQPRTSRADSDASGSYEAKD